MVEKPSFIFGNLLNNDFLASQGFDPLTNLLVTSEDPTFPIDLIRDDKVASVWRTNPEIPAVLSATITANYVPGNNHNIASLAIINHNLTSSATLTIQASSETDFSIINGSQTFNPGTTAVNFFTKTGIIAATDNWRLIISDPTNTNKTLEIGELWFSEAHEEFIRSFNFGFTRNRQRLQVVNATRSGNKTVADFGLQKSFDLQWTLLRGAARDQIVKLFDDSKGAFKPFLFIPDPTKSEVFEIRFEPTLSDTLTNPLLHSISGVRLIEEVGAVALRF